MQKGASSFHIFYLGYLLLYFSLVAGTQTECPLQLNPQRVVVRHGSSVEANCNTSVSHQGMGWESSQGAVSMTKDQSLITWRVSEVTEWDMKTYCYINYKINQDPCPVHLPVTVYKTPDSVSIRTVNHRGPMKEGERYELQCEVLNVAPVQNLTVKWYKGQTQLNQNSFTDTIETPENKAVTLLIRLNRTDDGAQYWCEAELNLGPEGPQPPPTNSSNPLNVEVHYKPQHSSSTEIIIKGDEVMLDCTVKANPAPTYTWHSDHLEEKIRSSVLPSSALSPGNYTCTATNTEGSDSKVFIVKDISISVNHTGPMIAGESYAFQCDVLNVDLSESVLVRWYKQNKTVSTENIQTSAVNRTSKLLITPLKTDDGAQYWCEAQLKGEGSQSYPTMSSERLSITVHYKPIINEINLPSTVPVFRGYPEVLVCKAVGNPKPTITWNYGTDHTYSENLTITESNLENVYCNASNSAGSTIRHVKVVLKEDYLPLIAGLIAVIVAFVSVIFIFIYSIYYKTAKMGHYSLKDGKPSSQNGNIAQNGKQNPLPMKKLSQSNILA